MGKTSLRSVVRWMSTDHPHTHGENFHQLFCLALFPGPSPHAWGKLIGKKFLIFSPRTIPTRMGKTFTVSPAVSDNSDHPHTHGENGVNGNLTRARLGPSPHAWGKRQGYATDSIPIRTIPTRMGKTNRRMYYSTEFSDHPHTHGENSKELRS